MGVLDQLAVVGQEGHGDADVGVIGVFALEAQPAAVAELVVGDAGEEAGFGLEDAAVEGVQVAPLAGGAAGEIAIAVELADLERLGLAGVIGESIVDRVQFLPDLVDAGLGVALLSCPSSQMLNGQP